MQLFAGELTNQNQEYYKVNDNLYCFSFTSINIFYTIRVPDNSNNYKLYIITGTGRMIIEGANIHMF